MKVVILLILCLITACQAALELHTEVQGTGLVILEGPGNFSERGHLEGNMSREWNLSESDFERRI